MITSRRMAAVDRNAEALGVPQRVLMESSGRAIATAVRAIAEPEDRITIVAGRGNNGGDAFVAARFLESFAPTVGLVGRPETIRTDIAKANWKALERSGFETVTWRDSRSISLGSPDIVIDALLGTGITGDLREPEATAARRINESAGTVLSVDVPSGLDADTGELSDGAVKADRVVTFHEMKPGLSDRSFPVTVADIGIPSAATEFVGPGDLSYLSRVPDSHKGENGEVLVVGGGPYTGAPALSAQACLRAGADLVRVACPDPVADEVAGYSENLIVRPLDGPVIAPGMVDRLVTMAREHDVTVLGPGLGDADPTIEAVTSLLERISGRVVVDADALSVVPGVETEAALICTPHRGELRQMGGPADPGTGRSGHELAEFARDIGAVVLLKGRVDVITDGETTRQNRTGNAGMTVGGTGDVLAGVVGSLAARQPPLRAASLAAYITGRAGDIAAESYADGLIATDLVNFIPEAANASPEAPI